MHLKNNYKFTVPKESEKQKYQTHCRVCVKKSLKMKMKAKVKLTTK